VNKQPLEPVSVTPEKEEWQNWSFNNETEPHVKE